MTRLRTYRRFLLIPMVAWLLTQLAMTGIVSAATPDVNDFRPGGNGGYTVVICTPTGWKTVTVNADGTADIAPEVDAYQACEYCQTPDGAPVLAATTPVGLTPIIGEATAWRHALSTAARPQHRPTGFLGRAPPA